MIARLRKIVTFLETIDREFDRPVSPPATRVCCAALIENPCAGRYVEDLSELIEIGAEMGTQLARRCLEVGGLRAEDIQSFGKAAMVGEAGEIEHAAAILHPSLGAPLRAILGGGKALVPSSKKMGGPGDTLDVPLGHKDAAYVRSHFDGMPVTIADGPRANEILVAIALAPTGRPLPRVGGLEHADIVGNDGLR
ncbi:amino acid synthesis family protein [Rhodospirillaceae bacterium KN72]|uniref:Amino acid synthesis family protein n=1 Tax=Pacificispira spongiicola TaxID=2729598 RepID=A0A7Y0DXD2_9PROT|nr:amino acid synthesis family protein [Pacificispira spongiicola]NMM43337.1 amino acid synthesis family protein [Pacificispira spongiicola]